jgi:hypothetical protein
MNTVGAAPYGVGTYGTFATTLSQLKICDFFREKILKVLKCSNFQ